MKDAFKLTTWLVLVLGWVAVVVYAFFFLDIGIAIGLGIVAIVCWVAWSYLITWLFGVRRRVQRHLGRPLSEATYLVKELPVSRVSDMRRALEFLYADKSSKNLRLGFTQSNIGETLSSLLHLDSESQPLQWTSIESREGHYDTLPTNAIYLLRHHQQPFAVCLGSMSDMPYADPFEGDVLRTAGGHKLEVFAESLPVATEIIEFLLRMASINSVYRGMMLHVSTRAGREATQAIRVSERPLIDQERIVLPAQVLQVLSRTIAARLEFHRLLQRHGHSSKTGLLLHGPPGTGKTLVAKHLIGTCQNHTAIVPADMEAETIREVFRLAAYLQPALIVIEDVDLLAERRETNANVTGLQELMNAMDGLSPTTEAIVLMTTNRPEILEPALASRPGRVSQAIHFPLPDDALRERLLTIFCSLADTTQVDLPRWVAQTSGASPAFLEELTKRALLFAAQRLTRPAVDDAIRLTDDDFDQAVHELVVFGGNLTGSLLGFPIAPS